MVQLIAAVSENNAIGLDNDLLWHLPDDFKRFKALTSGHFIIMGRKTFESFPKPLPNRTHVVITRQKDYQKEGCIVVHSLEEALAKVPEGENVFVIGGGEIYKQSIVVADIVDITRVHTVIERADTFFPDIDKETWELHYQEFHPKDEKHQYDFTFQTFKRIKR